MIITKIEQQKKNKNRVSIYIDDKFAFGINISIYEKYGLFNGKVVDEDFINEVILSEERNKAINYSLSLLSVKSRSKSEICKKLQAKEYEDNIIKSAVDYLELNKFIDDEHYAYSFTKEKIELNKYGRRKIKSKLFDKGIDPQLIDEQLINIDEELLLENAIHLATKKLATLNNIDKIKRNQKIYRFLISRGYEYTVIKKTLSEIEDICEEENKTT